MARSKPQTPIRREPSETFRRANGVDYKLQNGGDSKKEKEEKKLDGVLGAEVQKQAEVHGRHEHDSRQSGLVALAVCVGGIYASFLSWAYLQERITTTPYGPSSLRFTYPIFLNTIQSSFAALTGYTYLYFSSPINPTTNSRQIPSPFPSKAILWPLLLIAVTSSLASPFGYASLRHIDYVTFILAKSCKLLPVMFLHVTIFRKKYPLYKYLVVVAVTLGVAIFTLHHPSTAKKAAKKGGKGMEEASKALGLFLLGINLLFDGLTNTVQDQIFTSFKGFTGPQMMCAQNVMSTVLTVSYMLVQPWLAGSWVGEWVGVGKGGELRGALEFVGKYPGVGWDVLGFAACGAVGQVFIFHTLAHFSSLLLVTVTVTRKMLTMLLSVVLFGHQVTGMQWLGVGFVFGGIGAEAVVTRREKAAKEKAKKAAKAEREKEL